MTETIPRGEGAARRARIEAALADYPHVSAERLDELVRWFTKEASSLDIALLASNETIAEPYQRFRSDHIDPIKGWDIFRGILALAAVGVVILVIAWRAL